MNAVRIRTRIESETLRLPEPSPMIGREVEIIVLDDTATDRGSAMGKLHELAGEIDLDYEAIEDLRRISTI